MKLISSIQYAMTISGINMDDKNIRRSIEDTLEDFQFTSIAATMGMPLEYPRMVGQTKGGHSYLQLSNSEIRLIINFDQNYYDDHDACFQYAYSKIDRVEHTMQQLGMDVAYIGLVAQYVDTEKTDPLYELSKNLMRLKSTPQLFNASAKFAVIEQNKYYVNIELSVLHMKKEAGQSPQKALGISVDINNKYEKDFNGSIATNNGDLKEIERLHRLIGYAKINRLLNTGEFDLNG